MAFRRRGEKRQLLVNFSPLSIKRVGGEIRLKAVADAAYPPERHDDAGNIRA